MTHPFLGGSTIYGAHPLANLPGPMCPGLRQPTVPPRPSPAQYLSAFFPPPWYTWVPSRAATSCSTGENCRGGCGWGSGTGARPSPQRPRPLTAETSTRSPPPACSSFRRGFYPHFSLSARGCCIAAVCAAALRGGCWCCLWGGGLRAAAGGAAAAAAVTRRCHRLLPSACLVQLPPWLLSPSLTLRAWVGPPAGLRWCLGWMMTPRCRCRRPLRRRRRLRQHH